MKYENIKLNSLEYSKLSNEEKLELVKERINNILNEKADKHQITVVYNGKKIKVNKDKVGLLRDLSSRERSLEKKIKHRVLKEVIKEEPKVSKEKKTNVLKEFIICELNTDAYKNKSSEEKVEIIKGLKSHLNDCIKKSGLSEEIYEANEYLNALLEKLYIDIISNNINRQEEEKVEEKVEKVEEKVEKVEEKKKKGLFGLLLGLPLISKIRSKKDNIEKVWSKKHREVKRRIAAALCAGIIAITGFVGIKNAAQSSKDNLNTRTNITEVNNDKDDKKDDELVIKEEPKEEESISFDDVVTIDNGSPIYTNSYDASYNTNGYTALYDNSYDRVVEAVSYELDGKVYTIFKNEENASEKVDMLINSGAKLSAVLVTRTDLVNGATHEGYYDSDNVKVRMR